MMTAKTKSFTFTTIYQFWKVAPTLRKTVTSYGQIYFIIFPKFFRIEDLFCCTKLFLSFFCGALVKHIHVDTMCRPRKARRNRLYSLTTLHQGRTTVKCMRQFYTKPYCSLKLLHAPHLLSLLYSTTHSIICTRSRANTYQCPIQCNQWWCTLQKFYLCIFYFILESLLFPLNRIKK